MPHYYDKVNTRIEYKAKKWYNKKKIEIKIKMQLTKTQKKYYQKIKNKQIKELISKSYSFASMDEDEKNDFLIWASLIHEDKNAQQGLLEALKNESSSQSAVFEDKALYTMTEEEESKQNEIINAENAELKQKENDLNRNIRIEVEKEDQRQDEKNLENILDQLNKA